MAIERKVLLAVDGSPEAGRAVDYLGRLRAEQIPELRVALLHIMNPLPPFLRQESSTHPDEFNKLRALERRNLAEAKKVLSRAREILLRMDFPDCQIEERALPRATEAARDILFSSEQGMYDAVVLGRRGLSKTHELLVGSVTSRVLHHAHRTPVWIVGGRIKGNRVLCPVDGSQGSLKAVDHLAFMLGESEEVGITLFHAGSNLGRYCPIDFSPQEAAQMEADIMESEQRCMEDFYPRALAIFKEAGLAPGQVEVVGRPGKGGVVKTILNEIRSDGYGTVVLGRTGGDRTSFLGHVSDRVVAKAGEVAVWVVA